MTYFFFINYSDLYTYLIKTRKKIVSLNRKIDYVTMYSNFLIYSKKNLKNKDIIQNNIYTQKVHNEQKKLKHI